MKVCDYSIDFLSKTKEEASDFKKCAKSDCCVDPADEQNGTMSKAMEWYTDALYDMLKEE